MSKEYEIYEEEQINERDNTPFIFYRVRGIVEKHEDLPKTESGWTVYPELKLCPFCGGRPKVLTKSKTIIKGVPNRNYYVQCTKCGARASRFIAEDFNNDGGQTKLEAINAWNKRYVPIFNEYSN